MKETVPLNPSMDPQVFLPRQFRRHIFTNVQAGLSIVKRIPSN